MTDIPIALLYATPYALLAAWLAARFVHAPDSRKALLSVFAAALAGGVVYALAIHNNPWSAETIFYHTDDASYNRWGERIANRWRAGDDAALVLDWKAIGSLHTGYYRLVAGVYYLLGPRPLLIVFLNILAMAAIAPALYWLAHETLGREAANYAGWLCALYPTFWFHSAFLLRDAWITLFFVATLAVWFESRRSGAGRRGLYRIFLHACLAAFLAQLTLYRYYAMLFIVAAIALWALAEPRTRKPAIGALAVGLAVAIAARTFGPVRSMQDTMWMSFTWSIPRELESLRVVGVRFAGAAIKLFLGPFPWAGTGGYSIDYFMWPGQWMLYLLLLPFGAWGLYRCARRDSIDNIVLLLPFIAAYFGFATAYSGAAPRQRMFLDALLILFAARGLSEAREGTGPPRRYYWIYYCGLAALVAGHVASLFYRGIWSF